jgi:hypothetical protein
MMAKLLFSEHRDGNVSKGQGFASEDPDTRTEIVVPQQGKPGHRVVFRSRVMARSGARRPKRNPRSCKRGAERSAVSEHRGGAHLSMHRGVAFITGGINNPIVKSKCMREVGQLLSNKKHWYQARTHRIRAEG